MTRSPHPPAAHVQAAIARGQGTAGGPAQAKTSQPAGEAAHVQDAIARGHGHGAAISSPAAGAQMRAPRASAPPTPDHVQRAIDAGRGGAVQARVAPPSESIQPSGTVQASGDFITYTDLKSPTSPPPPPRWPVYSMSCGDGGDCSLRDLKTGRTRPAGDLYAGFVRVSPGGPVYVSPRPDVGLQGDSHPSIASVTPEERSGRGAIVAAGEVGFLNNQIVGHNDKTGHYRTRRNYWQSGLPMEKYHSFTVDPHDWYRQQAKSSGSADD